MVPVLIVNPHDDATFVAAAESRLERGDDPEALQAVLRQDYPFAVVRAREISDATGEIWYVYRDGHWTQPQSDVRADLAHTR